MLAVTTPAVRRAGLEKAVHLVGAACDPAFLSSSATAMSVTEARALLCGMDPHTVVDPKKRLSAALVGSVKHDGQKSQKTFALLFARGQCQVHGTVSF